jgi:tetraprenyl-beta-curcumene synthase
MLRMLRIVIELVKYEAIIVPQARREIRRWTATAVAIPDPRLRETATCAIAIDASNAEAAAAFAVMVPRARSRVAIELLVAYQILLDYVDALGERICTDDVLRSLAVGVALTAAFARPGATLALESLGDDGGYLAALVMACRSRLWQLPSACAVEQDARAAAERCAQALAYTHAAAKRGTSEDLRGWTATQATTTGYAWWEIAAGGNSDLAILALLAAAADPATTRNRAAAVAAAYWPHVCVLSTLLDSLVDYERDATTDNFSFVARYPDRVALRNGLTQATARSLAATAPLRHCHAHAMIVGGVACYYAASVTPGSLAAQVAPTVVATLGSAAMPIVLALQARHRLGGIQTR